VAAAAACGCVNGVLITRLKVVPFIVTLGTMLIVRGAAKGLAEERRIEAPITWLNDLLRTQSGAPACRPASGAVVVALVVAGCSRYTRFGRHVFAIGSNERMARLCGVAISRTRSPVYTMSAALVGMAGLLQSRSSRSAIRRSASALELDVIAAVIIGGGSLTGGAARSPARSWRRDHDIIQIGCSQKGWPTGFSRSSRGIIVAAVRSIACIGAMVRDHEVYRL
jgi:ribose/xylose/arabinose/galactoside ABC-type transport system permease subunit